jgi:hypothetical protein
MLNELLSDIELLAPYYDLSGTMSAGVQPPKTSEPSPSGTMKPNPRSVLKNLTRPVGMPLILGRCSPVIGLAQ